MPPQASAAAAGHEPRPAAPATRRGWHLEAQASHLRIVDQYTDGGPMVRVRALIIASHPGPCLAITAMATLLAAEAAPHGIGPGAGRAGGARRAAVGRLVQRRLRRGAGHAAGRADKPVARGEVSVRALWIAAVASRWRPRWRWRAAIGLVTLAIAAALTVAAAWAYNLGLKSTLWSGADVPARVRPAARVRGLDAARAPAGALAVTRRGGPARARRALRQRAARPGRRPAHRGARPAAAASRPAGAPAPPGPPPWCCCCRPRRCCVVAASPARRWVAVAGLCCRGVLAVAGARGRGTDAVPGRDRHRRRRRRAVRRWAPRR